MIHLLKERNAKLCTTKCGINTSVDMTTAWWRDVTCPDCLTLMTPDTSVELAPRRRLVRVRPRS